MALARMIQIGSARVSRDGFKKKLLSRAEEVLARAGERTRLSSAHTVVVLAGGTGSGKSSLFNRMAGANFSTVGVTRPVTRDAHACIWGEAGSGALLEWLGVPVRNRYARASALDKGEDDLAGLVLLDLPDHDSVMSHSTGLVDRLVSQADVMIWILDPQKYADAAVHRRFLIPLAGHSDVLAAVLNQSDQLDAAQIDDCVHDLRRLLDSENLHDVPILVTSAVTGAGLEDLRKLLIQGVAARRAAAARISDDVDMIVAQFVPFAGDQDTPSVRVSAQGRERLVEQFSAAAGVTAVGDALRSARQLRAADFVGWPVAWLAQRLTGRDPLRKMRLGQLWNELRSITTGPSGAQQAEIDNALTELADQLADPLAKPWSQTVRTAVRSRADQIPAAIGQAIGETLPAEDSISWWWRLAGLGQGLLLGAVVVSIVWMTVIVVFGVFHAASGVPHLFSSASELIWLILVTAAMLGLGLAISSVCMSWVSKAAEAERTAVTIEMRGKIAVLAAEMVIMPAEQELSELDRFREELRIALRGTVPTPASSTPAS
jgi:energy-coupling factor transporter ATP-binding protein EcfA2